MFLLFYDFANFLSNLIIDCMLNVQLEDFDFIGKKRIMFNFIENNSTLIKRAYLLCRSLEFKSQTGQILHSETRSWVR